MRSAALQETTRSAIRCTPLCALALATFLASPTPVHADPFTKVTGTTIVNDGGISGGVSWADYDGDDDLDLFVANAQNDLNFLYRNEGTGSYTRITSGHLVTDAGRSSGNTWGDYDNDGDVDLFVSVQGDSSNLLYRNEGGGSLELMTTGVIVTDIGDSHHATWGDYDNDGLLDLFVANGGFSSAQANFLYHNDGSGNFTKITTGNMVTHTGRTFSGSWADYDHDGSLDLFVPYWQNTRDRLYHNNGDGTFGRITGVPPVNEFASSIGGSWADYDNDGDLDLFVTNQAAGQPNRLFRNAGDGTFDAVPDEPFASDLGSSWCGVWADHDNDGDQDLFVTNFATDNFLYRNEGDGSFTRDTTSVVASDVGLSSGASWGDHDNDGDLDLYVANWEGQNNFFYENNGNSNHWINLRCVGVVSNGSAIGARVRAKAQIGGQTVWQLREIASNTAVRSQNSLNVEFGFGDATMIDLITVEWPSGILDIYTDVPVDQFLVLNEGATTTAAPMNPAERKDGGPQLVAQPNPSREQQHVVLSFGLDKAAYTTLEVYDVSGRRVATLHEGWMQTGLHEIAWRDPDVTSGIYFGRLQVGDNVETRRFVRLK